MPNMLKEPKTKGGAEQTDTLVVSSLFEVLRVLEHVSTI